MDIHVPKRVSSVATTYYGTLGGIARQYHDMLLTLSPILTSTEKRWLELEMAGKDDERRVLAAMKDGMAGGFRAGVLLSSPVDVIGHKRVEPSQTIPDPCSDPSSSDDKKVPHIHSVHAHRVLRFCGFIEAEL